jgi:hypothetical protein
MAIHGFEKSMVPAIACMIDRLPNVFMITMDHQTFRAMVEEGKIEVGVEPAIARRFFTDSTFAIQRALVAEPIYIERAIVTGTYLLTWLTMLVSFRWAWMAFGWGSLLLIPVSAIVWMYHYGRASIGKPALWPLAAAIGMVLHWNSGGNSHPAYEWAAIVLTSMLLSRIVYRARAAFSAC